MIIKTFKKNISNIIGWKTSRKIIIIESDDWGSVRIRSKNDFDEMISKGLDLEKSIFTLYDSLESNEDLENLFELLTKFKDSNGRHPVITPLCIVANPDFKKIREQGFNNYYFENLRVTCEKYPNHSRVIDLWKEGFENQLFVPSLHGREHLNVIRWMNLLKSGNSGILTAFNYESLGVSHYNGILIPEYLGAFHPEKKSEIPSFGNIVLDAGRIFNEILGYYPKHFIAPNREAPKVLEEYLASIGVKYLTKSKILRYPLGDGKFKTEFNWLGKKNQVLDQIYLTRNCAFEPARREIDYVDSALKEIEIAFKWMKPAIISSHRVNYIGNIQPENSSYGLKELSRLFKSVINNWPQVEFMTSPELGVLINSGEK